MKETHPDIIVFCRRAVDWLGFSHKPGDAASRFNTTHPLRKLEDEWNSANPAMPLRKYRHELHKIARESWEATGAKILLNWIPPTSDNEILSPMQLGIIRKAQWVIPIDDDDWLAPGICKVLKERVFHHPQGENGIAWKAMVLHVDRGNVAHEPPRAFLAPRPSDDNTILSCAYALGKAGIRSLNDADLSGMLIAHGGASKWLDRVGMNPPLDDILSLHLRHCATAGAAGKSSLAALNAASFAIPKSGWPEGGEWAIGSLEMLQAVHATGQAQQKTAS